MRFYRGSFSFISILFSSIFLASFEAHAIRAVEIPDCESHTVQCDILEFIPPSHFYCVDAEGEHFEDFYNDPEFCDVGQQTEGIRVDLWSEQVTFLCCENEKVRTPSLSDLWQPRR